MAAIARAFRLHDRARTDNRHLAPQDVDQLRQLVDARLAIEATKACHARIIAQLLIPIPFGAGDGVFCKQCFKPLLGIDHHRPELETTETASAAPQALVGKDG